MVMQGATADIGDTAVAFVYVTSSLLGSGVRHHAAVLGAKVPVLWCGAGHAAVL